jgi:dTDP-4-amino-4,6-dideoxygalactose transaminase
MIPLAQPQIGWQERRAVNKVLKSLQLTQGPEVKAFESEFSKIVGDRECVAVNSGTSALHLCLIALGIGKGDEVIVPSFTFAASANVISLVGATPIFVDINPLTYCLEPEIIQNSITSRTKAIIAVHLFGLVADMVNITNVAKRNNLLVIEDAAQAHLAELAGTTAGSFGDAAAFSFYPTKNMTTGEGGMAVFPKVEHAQICRLLRNQGMQKRYENEIVGFNLRMTDIQAAIGRVQLKKLEEMTKKRIENSIFLSKYLDTDQLPYVPDGYKHVFHQFTVRIESNRDAFAKELREAGVGCDVYYPTQVHKLKSFSSENFLPETEKACREVLSLPIHPGLGKRDLKKIIVEFNTLTRNSK